MSSTGIFLPEAEVRVGRTKLAALLPMAVAIAGLAFILISRANGSSSSAEVAATAGIDPIVTGAIMTPDDRRQALIMLDR